jgi:hypothetical protein
VIESRYSVGWKDGRRDGFSWRGLGVRAASGQLLTPAEAVEPWMFDSVVADGIASGTIEVLPESIDIVAQAVSASGRGTYSLQNGKLKVLSVAPDRSKMISAARRKLYPVRQRGTASNIALLEITSDNRNLHGMKFSLRDDAGESVAIFRLRNGTNSPVVELLTVSALTEPGSLRLTDPVDSRAYGSPVISAHGLIGILQDPQSVLSMRELQQTLRTSAREH